MLPAESVPNKPFSKGVPQPLESGEGMGHVGVPFLYTLFMELHCTGPWRKFFRVMKVWEGMDEGEWVGLMGTARRLGFQDPGILGSC